MADNEVELEHKDVEEHLYYDDFDTTGRQAYVEVLKASGWKVVPKSRRTEEGDK